MVVRLKIRISTKKLNTKNLQIMQCLSPKCYDIQTGLVQFKNQKKTAKKVT